MYPKYLHNKGIIFHHTLDTNAMVFFALNIFFICIDIDNIYIAKININIIFQNSIYSCFI